MRKWLETKRKKKEKKRDLSKVNKYIGELRLQSNMWMGMKDFKKT